jgi:L-alanine-DL-glutamate epimerase-like enolase superfamily enzyme
MAIAAIDISLWDLKAKALGLPLIVLLGAARNSVPAYGSGGFTTYTAEQLQTQLGGWAAAGLPAVKIKIGADISTETARLTHARDAIGENVELYVDANGAYRCKQALAIADVCADFGVSWFEEPVSSDDLDGLRLIRNRAPPGVDIAAGEYGYDAYYFRRMLGAGAVDVLQIDATRCAGFTGFLRAAAVADAFSIPVSPHTAPALHAHVACTLSALRPIELFHDHARIEGMLFDGAPELRDGALWPNTTRPGHGLELRQADAARFELAT